MLVSLSSTSSDRVSAAVAAVGGVSALVPLLNCTQGNVNYFAAWALANLCGNMICREGFHLSGGVNRLENLLCSPTAEVRLQALRLLVAVCKEPKIRAKAATSCIPALVSILLNTQETVNLASRAELTEQATQTLLLFCQDSSANRRLMLANKGLPCVLSLLQKGTPVIQSSCVHMMALMSSLSQARPIMCNVDTISLLLDLLLTYTEKETEGGQKQVQAGLQEDICKILSRLPLQEKEALEVHRAGGLLVLVGLMGTERPLLRRLVLATITNLALFPETRTTILQEGALHHIFRILGEQLQEADPHELEDEEDGTIIRFPPVPHQAIAALYLLSSDSSFASAVHEAQGMYSFCLARCHFLFIFTFLCP